LTKDQLYNALNYVNHSREKRLYYANLVIDNPELVAPLLEILFEFMCGEQLEAIIPNLDTFTQNISRVHLDSAVRPVAKVCEYLIKAHYSKKDNKIKTALTEAHKEKIVEACFDWMINDEKIAPKAYSINSLYLLGNEYDWVHPELAMILERDFQMQSSGFKARARHILKKINSKS